jgi:hypothetical protein
MPTIQQRMALLSRYNKHYKFKYDVDPSYNKWVEQWAADALIDSYTLDVCYELLEYYFSVSESPTWNFFSYNAEKLLKAKKDKDADLKERLERREKAKEWLSE